MLSSVTNLYDGKNIVNKFTISECIRGQNWNGKNLGKCYKLLEKNMVYPMGKVQGTEARCGWGITGVIREKHLGVI